MNWMNTPEDILKAGSGRRTMVLVLLACVVPFVLAFLALKFEWFSTTNNYGTLIQPQPSVPSTEFQNINGEPFSMAEVDGKWVLIQVIKSSCDRICQNAMYFQRQARKTKGKEMHRIERLVFVTDDGPLDTQLLRQFPQVRFVRAPEGRLNGWLPLEGGVQGTRSVAEVKGLHDHIFVVDPLGHVMMRFPPNELLDFKRFRKDVSRLLWASNIG